MESSSSFAKIAEYFGASLQSNFAPVDEIDEAIEIHQIEGAIPEDFPEGVYIRNGDRFSLYLLLYQSIRRGVDCKPYPEW
jgi:carotenoid cleavage dioxygenase-like enzyme